MFLAVSGVGRRAVAVEPVVGVAEHETDVDLWALLTDEVMLLPVGDIPNPLRLDVKKAAGFRQLEVGTVSGLA